MATCFSRFHGRVHLFPRARGPSLRWQDREVPEGVSARRETSHSTRSNNAPMARLTAVVSLLVLAAPLAPGANAGGPSNLPQGEGFLYTRPVTVTAPGWVRVPLDLNTLRHLSPGSPPGADLRVFSPEGVEVASRVATYPPEVLGRV